MFIFPQVFALAAYTHAIDSLKNVLITLGTSIGAVMLVQTDGSAGRTSGGLLGGGRRCTFGTRRTGGGFNLKEGERNGNGSKSTL